MGKVQVLFLRSFVIVLTKFPFWRKDWALGYDSMKFRDFLDISKFPNFRLLNFEVLRLYNVYY